MRPSCRECWDPVDRDGAELCDWCSSTPAQRRRSVVRDAVLSILGVLALAALMVGLAGTA